MDDSRYCLCCDEQVPFGVVSRGEREEITCNYCGFTLDVANPSEGPAEKTKGCALVADDSRYTRKIIEELIGEKKFSSEVMSFENGLELTTAYSKLLAEGRPVEVAIIDLNMPVMNGITTARTVRTIEAQNKAPYVPIVFFSAEKAATVRTSLKRSIVASKPTSTTPESAPGTPPAISPSSEVVRG